VKEQRRPLSWSRATRGLTLPRPGRDAAGRKRTKDTAVKKPATSLPPEIAEIVGDLHELDLSLRRFRHSAEVWAEEFESFLERYEGKWVALYDGEVVLVAETLEEILDLADAQGLPRTELFVERAAYRRFSLVLLDD
jgi:hypothetical protein